ncbi:hypothetical protein J2Q11_12330 [Tenacibaculum finnmarkense genomovar finnmarkense]|uniref:hypothetical protein n=1 Tax=Tenacibaculum finnmarkense TaxID=2781243 RepID=UPI001EFA4D7F|nr:hypothetical protein [Tenacibaculum finnmarkense]MCG8213588.1 hypothetical protein [Tenacibaculum finnmarkense genomovar finnmarkense]MCG8231917.1 hypothetical protein [Tenacibaculum finnmarkense genomovar finnmarkense]MCG8886469.1 hypothetical protein [Tenacibaculum finnmarkense]MCG8897251.1 hypothetical protein [Tenacibaculum finnmarkense]MCG8903971.1 hypothetical protein [Tenacibaculum finnmarkense]
MDIKSLKTNSVSDRFFQNLMNKTGVLLEDECASLTVSEGGMDIDVYKRVEDTVFQAESLNLKLSFRQNRILDLKLDRALDDFYSEQEEEENACTDGAFNHSDYGHFTSLIFQ